MSYTIKDLKRNSDAYDRNFEKIVLSGKGSREHRSLLQKENELNKKSKEIRESIGIRGYYEQKSKATVTPITPSNVVSVWI